MNERIEVLWVEDGADAEAYELPGPVERSGRYELETALTISDAISKICGSEFDIVVVDIRMEPGYLPEWRLAYDQAGSDKSHARLGLLLLQSLFDESPSIPLATKPAWVDPSRFGVLSVEREHDLRSELDFLGITAYREKLSEDNTLLLEFADDMATSLGL